MHGCVYTLESEATRPNCDERSVSAAAAMAIEAGINERLGIHYQELTDPANPRPMFALFFAEAQQRDLFEAQFGPALRLCGLRVAVVRALAENEETRKPDFGYIDRERGYAIFLPTLPAGIEDPQS